MLLQSTCSAPTNIAVIKYWGKDNVALNTPINSSVSVTLNPKDLETITTVVASKDFPTNRLWLNGQEEEINKRVEKVLNELLKLTSTSSWSEYKFHIISKNTFPTAAGLASSASGYACLVGALVDLLNCKEEFPGQFSTIARQGSGSACRSLYGGFVRWQKGMNEDGSDSCAIQLNTEEHWKELKAFICVANDKKKDTSSTTGMMTSKETSELLTFRAKSIVETRLKAMEQAYEDKDFATFGELMMKDSNQFHATCLDTYPPIFYLNETSKAIIHLVHQYNAQSNEIRAAYTFDAGPNAVLFVEKAHEAEFFQLLLHYFPAPIFSATPYVVGTMIPPSPSVPIDSSLLNKIRLEPERGLVRKIYCTNVGRGIKTLDSEQSLVDATSGLPLKTVDINPTAPVGSTTIASGVLLLLAALYVNQRRY